MLAVIAFSADGRCVSAGFERIFWQQKPRWEKQLPLMDIAMNSGRLDART